MKILVCISKVPDTTSKISFSDNNTKFVEAGVQFIINPYDEWYALVRSLEIKELLGGTVTVINAGKADNEQIIRKALALGADDAVRIDLDAKDAYEVAANIAEYAKNESYDIILTGKETIDYNGGMLGGMLAEMLDLPYISMASKLDIENNTLKIERETEGTKEIVTAQMPCVVSAQKGMAEARIPNMRGILSAKSKPIKLIAPATIQAVASVKSFSLPPEKSSVKIIPLEKIDELVELLHNEAKVI